MKFAIWFIRHMAFQGLITIKFAMDLILNPLFWGAVISCGFYRNEHVIKIVVEKQTLELKLQIILVNRLVR